MESGCSVFGTAIFCKEVIPVGLFYEADKTFDDLMKEKKNFVFIGEAGSGKSEIVLNIANKLAQQTGKQVDLLTSIRPSLCTGPVTCRRILQSAVSTFFIRISILTHL